MLQNRFKAAKIGFFAESISIMNKRHNGYGFVVVGYWLLVIGCWLLVIINLNPSPITNPLSPITFHQCKLIVHTCEFIEAKSYFVWSLKQLILYLLNKAKVLLKDV